MRGRESAAGEEHIQSEISDFETQFSTFPRTAADLGSGSTPEADVDGPSQKSLM